MAEKSYSRIFNEKSQNWDNDPNFNYMFLKTVEQRANDILKTKGYLFLRDVYEMLGIGPITKESIVAGWYRDSNNVIKKITFRIQYSPINEEIELIFDVEENILNFFEKEQDE